MQQQTSIGKHNTVMHPGGEIIHQFSLKVAFLDVEHNKQLNILKSRIASSISTWTMK